MNKSEWKKKKSWVVSSKFIYNKFVIMLSMLKLLNVGVNIYMGPLILNIFWINEDVKQQTPWHRSLVITSMRSSHEHERQQESHGGSSDEEKASSHFHLAHRSRIHPTPRMVLYVWFSKSFERFECKLS